MISKDLQCEFYRSRDRFHAEPHVSIGPVGTTIRLLQFAIVLPQAFVIRVQLDYSTSKSLRFANLPSTCQGTVGDSAFAAFDRQILTNHCIQRAKAEEQCTNFKGPDTTHTHERPTHPPERSDMGCSSTSSTRLSCSGRTKAPENSVVYG
jgi:hypothetical protein